MRNVKPLFNDYEIHGVRAFGEGTDRHFEQVPEAEAELWTLFGHIPGQGLEAIGDFATRELAEEVLYRITGPNDPDERSRLTRAAPVLLAALADATDKLEWYADAFMGGWDHQFDAQYFALNWVRDAAGQLATAYPLPAVTDRQIHAILAERHSVAQIWDVEHVTIFRHDLSGEQAWDVLLRAKGYGNITSETLREHAAYLFPPAQSETVGKATALVGTAADQASLPSPAEIAGEQQPYKPEQEQSRGNGQEPGRSL